MPLPPPESRRLTFGVFTADPSLGRLLKDGIPVKLAPQPFKVLLLLIERRGGMVGREEIREHLWGNSTFVDFERGINFSINQIRAVLSDDVERPHYIETLPKIGYRFIAEVTEQNGDSDRIAVRRASSPSEPLNAIESVPAMLVQVSGDRFLAPMASNEQTKELALKTRRWKLVIPAAIVTLAVVALAGGLFWHHRKSRLTEKDTVVLADFMNTTGDSVFDDTLKQGLRVQLEQSPFLNILSDQQVDEQLKLMARSAGERLTPELARDVCQRVGSKAILNGSISTLGTHYVLGLNALNCHNGNVLTTEQVEADSREHVLKALGDAATKMRKKLGESLTSIEKYDAPVEQATTSSLDALRAYSLGVKAWRSGGQVAAVGSFRHAVELDPKFAIAYVRMAEAYYNLAELSFAAESVKKAYNLRAQVSERERFFIDAYYYDLAVGEIEKSMRVLEQWNRTYPHDEMPYLTLAADESIIGNYEQCVREAKQARLIDPDKTSNYLILAECHIALNQLDQAEADFREAEARKLERDYLLQEHYLLAFRRENNEEMERVVSLARKPGTEDVVLFTHADAEAFHGHLRKARELSKQAEESALRNDAKEAAALWRLNATLWEAEFGNARQATQRVGAPAKGRYVQAMAALALARAGDVVQAEAIAETASQRFPRDTVLNNYWLPSVRAAVALCRKNSSSAIDALRVTAPYELGQPPPLDLLSTMYPTYLRGEAYLMERNGLAAAAEFKRIIEHPGIVLNFPLGALAHVQIGRAYALAGKTREAKASYERFFALWKDADEDIAVLRQAKLEYAKLK